MHIYDDAQPLTTNQRILQSFQLPLIQALLLYLVVLCVYVPTFWHTYVWDDWMMIAHNESLREWKNIPRYFTDPNTFSHDPGDKGRNEWRPLRNIYYLITYKIHGLHPAGWHFQHVLLHSLLASMLLVLFKRIYRYAMAWPEEKLLPVSIQMATWFAVLGWAVHPANIEVTAWLKSADDVIACLLTCTSLLILFPTNHRLTYLRASIAAAIFAVAFLAKESIAPTPLIYFLLALVLSPAPHTVLKYKQFWLASSLLFCGLFIYVGLRKLMLGQLEQVPYLAGNLSNMMATMTTAVVRYLQLTFWPFWPTVQIPDYVGWPLEKSWTSPRVILSLCIITSIGVTVAIIARRSKVFLGGWIFAIVAFTPVANIIPMMQVMAERFMYFPLIGIALAVAALLKCWLQFGSRKKVLLPAALCATLATTTIMRLPGWSDEETFRETAVTAAPAGSWRPMFNYALSKYHEGDTTEALRLHFAILADHPNEDSAIIVAIILAEQGHTTSATKYLDKVTSAFPDSPRPLALKADLARMAGDTTSALKLYKQALAKEPNNLQLKKWIDQLGEKENTSTLNSFTTGTAE